MASSCRFSAWLSLVEQAERYASRGDFWYRLNPMRSSTVKGFLPRSVTSKELFEGSDGCDSPWPAKWKIVVVLRADKTASLGGRSSVTLEIESGRMLANLSTSSLANLRFECPGVVSIDTSKALSGAELGFFFCEFGRTCRSTLLDGLYDNATLSSVVSVDRG